MWVLSEKSHKRDCSLATEAVKKRVSFHLWCKLPIQLFHWAWQKQVHLSLWLFWLWSQQGGIWTPLTSFFPFLFLKDSHKHYSEHQERQTFSWRSLQVNTWKTRHARKFRYLEGLEWRNGDVLTEAKHECFYQNMVLNLAWVAQQISLCCWEISHCDFLGTHLAHKRDHMNSSGDQQLSLFTKWGSKNWNISVSCL